VGCECAFVSLGPEGSITSLDHWWKRQLDGFIADPLTAKLFNPLTNLMKADATLSDHLLSFKLEERPWEK
jgi:hypothetical protein